MGRWIIAAVLAVLAVACGSLGTVHVQLTPERLERYVRLERPIYLPRGAVRYDCGPEALAAVLAYHGCPVSIEEISRRIFDPERRGTLSPMLAPTAREFGFRATHVEGSLARLRDSIGRDTPPIVMVRVRNGLYHFFVVSGYSDAERTVLCEDYDGQKRLIDYDQFLRLWQGAGWFMLEIAPGTASSDFARGADLEVRGEYAAALEWYRRAIQKDPEHAPAWVGMGNCLLLEQDIAEAISAYRRAVELAPQDPRALNNLAHGLLERGDTSDEPRDLAERAVRIYEERVRRLREPWNAASTDRDREVVQAQLTTTEIELAMALGTLAEVRSRTGQPTLAISAWKASYDLLPLTYHDLRARRLESIGQAYLRLGIHSQASTFLEQALRTANDEETRVRIREALENLP